MILFLIMEWNQYYTLKLKIQNKEFLFLEEEKTFNIIL